MILPLDEEYARREWSPRFYFKTQAFALVSLVVLGVGIPRGWFDSSLASVTTHVVLFAVIDGAIVFWLGVPRFREAQWWPMRVLDNLARLSISACFGASASSPSSPAWALVLLFGVIWPSKGVSSPLVATAILVVPPVMRGLWAPELDLSGLLVATGVGALTLCLYAVGGVVAERQRRVRARRNAQLALAATARERADAFRAAMSLHDGLSGGLYVARQLAHASSNVDEICAAAGGIVERSRRVVTDILVGGFSGGAPFEEALRAAAALGGATVTLSVRGDLEAARHSASDIVAIVAEAASNAARHGVEPVQLDVSFDAARVKIRCASQRRPGSIVPSLGGRGLRNAKLRAEGHGGNVRITEQGNHFVLEAEWPVFSSNALERAALVFGALVFGCAVLGLSWLSESASGIFFGPLGLAYLSQVHALLNRTERELEDAIAERQVAERLRAGRLVDGSFEAELATLEHAVETRDPLRVRNTLDQLAERLRLLLGQLEAVADGAH